MGTGDELFEIEFWSGYRKMYLGMSVKRSSSFLSKAFYCIISLKMHLSP